MCVTSAHVPFGYAADTGAFRGFFQEITEGLLIITSAHLTTFDRATARPTTSVCMFLCHTREPRLHRRRSGWNSGGTHGERGR